MKAGKNDQKQAKNPERTPLFEREVQESISKERPRRVSWHDSQTERTDNESTQNADPVLGDSDPVLQHLLCQSLLYPRVSQTHTHQTFQRSFAVGNFNCSLLEVPLQDSCSHRLLSFKRCTSDSVCLHFCETTTTKNNSNLDMKTWQEKLREKEKKLQDILQNLIFLKLPFFISCLFEKISSRSLLWSTLLVIQSSLLLLLESSLHRVFLYIEKNFLKTRDKTRVLPFLTLKGNPALLLLSFLSREEYTFSWDNNNCRNFLIFDPLSTSSSSIDNVLLCKRSSFLSTVNDDNKRCILTKQSHTASQDDISRDLLEKRMSKIVKTRRNIAS